MVINKNVMKDMKKRRDEIIAKWEAYGLLDGLKGYIKPEIAKLYECCKVSKIEKVSGTYGDKFTDSIKAEDSLITKENGFENIVEGQGGSPYDTINKMHEKWKKENGYV